MLFSVVIPTYQDHEKLKKCVNSVLACRVGFDFEVIVVDNAEVHDKCLFEFTDSRVTVIHESSPGSYSARNRGAFCAKGKYIAFTDSDCIVDKNWLTEADKFFEKTNCDIIGGSVDIFKEKGGNEWIYIFEKNFAFQQSINVRNGHSVTANLFINNEKFKKLGGFDGNMKSGGDWEFTDRAVKNGIQLLYGELVKVYHPARKSLKSFFLKEKRYAAWGYLNIKKDFGHSGIRIFVSHLWNNFKKIMTRVRSVDSFQEKYIVIFLSIISYMYRSFIYLTILGKVMDPNKVR
jgi:glycosyltransferase involved in cell wall biosynthesis